MLRFTVSKVRNAHNDEDLLKWRNRKIEIGFINKTRTFECTYTARADATVLIFFPFILFFFFAGAVVVQLLSVDIGTHHHIWDFRVARIESHVYHENVWCLI